GGGGTSRPRRWPRARATPPPSRCTPGWSRCANPPLPPIDSPRSAMRSSSTLRRRRPATTWRRARGWSGPASCRKPPSWRASRCRSLRGPPLAQRAAELARGLSSPRWLEAWTTLAVRAGDLASLSLALEARAEAAQGADAADLLVEAAELSRALLDDGRAMALLRKARASDASSDAARRGLLAMPQLPTAERVDLLTEESRTADPA